MRRQVVVDGEPGVRDYVIVMRRRWRIVVLLGLLGLLAAVGLTLLQPTVYRAESRLLLQHSTSDPLVERPDANEAQRLLSNEVMLIESTGARDAVVAVYTGPLDPEDVKATVVGTDADVLQVTVDAEDAEDAAALVNTYVAEYAEYRREVRVSELLGASSVLKSKVDELKVQIDQLNAPITSLDVRIAIETNAVELDRLRTERARLVSQSSARLSDLQSQLGFYQQEFDKVQLSANLRASSSLTVLQAAEVPDGPISPQPVRNAVLGLVCGLLVGVAAAFARDQFDDALRDRETVDAIAGVPGLGSIPRLSGSGESADELVALRAPHSTSAEAFRSVRTSLKFVGVNRSVRVLQITSATQGEGKTFIAANLAVAIANTGQRVLVAGCDLRRPRLDVVEKVPAGPGLTELLVGEATIEQAIWASPEVEHLAVLRTGSVPPNPTELLASDAARALFSELTDRYDLVVLDCPPLLPVSDSLIIAAHVDVSLLVVREGTTTRENLARAVELLRQADAPLVGTILNGAAPRGGYAYDYNADQPSRSKRSRTETTSRRESAAPPAAPRAALEDEPLDEVLVADDPDADGSDLDEGLQELDVETARSSGGTRRTASTKGYEGAERPRSFTLRASRES